MTKDNDSYTPVSCGLHSEYELAIMHKTKLELTWLDAENSEQTETVLPEDLIIRNKQEILKVKTSDNTVHEIRLDKIQRFKII